MKVHKAVEPTNLTKKGLQALEDILHNRSADAILLPKYDGVYAQFKYDAVRDEWQAWSRTGERMYSLETPERLAYFKQPGNARPGIVYIGEAWIPGQPHAAINGAARRQSPQPELWFMVHDTYSVGDVERDGFDSMPFFDRLRRGWYISGREAKIVAAVVQHLDDDTGHTVESLLAYTKKFQTSAHGAYDGMILRDQMAPFVPGTGKDGGIYKLKPRKSLDLLIVDEHEELHPTKAGGYVTVEYNGVRTDVGSGLTQGMLVLIHEAEVDDRKYFVGQIAEVEFLDFTKDGKLREPVLKAIRWDKEKPDA